MSIAFVSAWTGLQNNNNTGGTNTGVNTTGADLIIVVGTSNTSISSLTDVNSNVYNLVTGFPISDGVGGDKVYCYYSKPSTVGAGHTISIATPASTFSTLEAACYSGFSANPTPYDTQGHAVNTTGTSQDLDSGGVVITNTSELLIGMGTINQGTTLVWTAGSGFTMRSSVNTAGSGGVGFLEDQIISVANTYHATANSGFAGNWCCALVAFTDVTSGGGNVATLAWVS